MKHLLSYSTFSPSPLTPMPTILPYLEAAAAHPDFKRDVLEYLNGGVSQRITLEGHAPRVKVARVLTQLLHAHPALPVERIRLHARSGCSDFSGQLTVVAGAHEHKIDFVWCCAWKAEQEGWKDCFGFWDQMRAAREHGWQCFRTWETVQVS